MLRLAVLVAVLHGALGSPPPTSLQAERLTDPPAVDTHRPRFSWKLPAASPSASATDVTDVPARQVAYQIQASPTALFSALLWDSGKTASNNTLDIEYGAAGRALLGASELVADQRVWWRVRVWTAATAADGGMADGGMGDGGMGDGGVGGGGRRRDRSCVCRRSVWVIRCGCGKGTRN